MLVFSVSAVGRVILLVGCKGINEYFNSVSLYILVK